jgi:hypothetical protein
MVRAHYEIAASSTNAVEGKQSTGLGLGLKSILDMHSAPAISRQKETGRGTVAHKALARRSLLTIHEPLEVRTTLQVVR